MRIVDAARLEGNTHSTRVALVPTSSPAAHSGDVVDPTLMKVRNDGMVW